METTGALILIAQGGPLEGMRWRLERPLIIGREPTCDIVVPDRQVSRRHARLTPQGDAVLVEDLESKNGTFCNGKRVVVPTRLREGDTLQIALAQRFAVVTLEPTLPLEDAPAGALPQGNKALHLDPATHQVWVRGREVFPPLSAAQFRLLEALYLREGEVVPRDALIRAVWGEDAVGISNQALDALVRRLRDRLAAFDAETPYIVTVRGHGLRLDNPRCTDES